MLVTARARALTRENCTQQVLVECDADVCYVHGFYICMMCVHMYIEIFEFIDFDFQLIICKLIVHVHVYMRARARAPRYR